MQLWYENMKAFATFLKGERMAVTDMLMSCTNIKSLKCVWALWMERLCNVHLLTTSAKLNRMTPKKS